MSFHVNVPNNYDLLSSVHSWIYPDIQPVPERTGDDYFGRVYNIENQLVTLVMKQSNVGESLKVDHSDCDLQERYLRKLVERTLSLRIKTDNAISKIRDDPIISHLASRLAGIRPYMSPTPYEALIKTIIQQQVSYKSANVFTKRMILGLTQPVEFKSQTWHCFPDAYTITRAGMNGLRKFGFGYKSEYIHRAASLVASEQLDINSLFGAPYDEVFSKLIPIRGIGEWTIRVLSLAGLGNFKVFAFNDLVIQKILGKLYNHGQRMTARQVREQSHVWGESGTMVLYLLMCAEVLGLINT